MPGRQCMSAISKELFTVHGGRQFATAPTDILLKKWKGDMTPNGDPTISKGSPRCCITETLIRLASFELQVEIPRIAILVADLANINGSTDSIDALFLLDSREDLVSFSTLEIITVSFNARQKRGNSLIL